MRRMVMALGGLLLAGLVSTTERASAAPVIQGQEPCAVGVGRECFNFGSGIVGLGNFDLRAYSFTAPSKGTAMVTFNGSLLCAADGSAGIKVADLVTQITNVNNAVAQPSEPGGLRIATVLNPATSQTLSLASTRVVKFSAAGTQTFHFRIRPLRIDRGTNCYAYNAAFSVVFVP